MKRGFTSRDLILAFTMRANGARWHTIARRLGRRSAAGIRRRLDWDFHIKSNSYSAAWMRAARQQ